MFVKGLPKWGAISLTKLTIFGTWWGRGSKTCQEREMARQFFGIIKVDTQFFWGEKKIPCFTNLVFTGLEVWIQKLFKAHQSFLQLPKPLLSYLSNSLRQVKKKKKKLKGTKLLLGEIGFLLLCLWDVNVLLGLSQDRFLGYLFKM